MPKSKTEEKLAVLSLKLDAAALDRADALIPHVRSTSGSRATRSSVLRSCIMRGLKALEDDLQDAGAGEGVVYVSEGGRDG